MDMCNEDTSDCSEGTMSVLVTNLENKFKVRDYLLNEVIEGLLKFSDVSKRIKSIKVILNSVIANYGSSSIYNDRNQILCKNDLDQILSLELLEEKVAKPLIAGEYYNELLKESVKLLFASSSYLPPEIYGKLFTIDLLMTLISISEVASTDINSNMEVWTSCISTIRNIICHFNLSNDLLNRIVSCFFNIVDESSVQLCNVIVVKILFKSSESDDLSPGTLQSNLCFTIKLSRRIVEYLVSVLHRTQETQILSTACSTLVTICEHSYGVDLFLESGGLKRIIELSLVVANKHEALVALESKCNKKSEVSQKHMVSSPKLNINVDQAFNELSFGALSVISKMAFTSNHNQILSLIESDVPDSLVRLLNCPITTSKCKARACNTLGNLACETDSEVQAIIDSDALKTLVVIFQNDLDHTVRVESAYAICACLSKANRKQIGYIISCNSKSNHLGDGTCMQLISNMLDFIVKCDPSDQSSIKLSKVVLNGVENILRVGEHEIKSYNLTENPYTRMFREAEVFCSPGDVKLSRVCFFPEYNIAKKARMLMDEFFKSTRPWNIEVVH
uniref:Armadillo/beta-catenin-like repeat n=1 Tax=Theileria annulata TaxID=5874 RepID=A0A3B0NCU3_THEAN